MGWTATGRERRGKRLFSFFIVIIIMYYRLLIFQMSIFNDVESYSKVFTMFHGVKYGSRVEKTAEYQSTGGLLAYTARLSARLKKCPSGAHESNFSNLS